MKIAKGYLWPHYVASVANGATQREIAEAAGVNQATASRWLSGSVVPTNAANVASFAQAYKRNVIEAFIAADLLSFKDARGALPAKGRRFLADLRHEFFPVLIAGGVIDEDGNWLLDNDQEPSRHLAAVADGDEANPAQAEEADAQAAKARAKQQAEIKRMKRGKGGE